MSAYVRDFVHSVKRVHCWSHGSMDRAFADAVIQFALWRDPARVCGVIADVTGELEARGYSAEEIEAAIDELLDELQGSGQPRH